MGDRLAYPVACAHGRIGVEVDPKSGGFKRGENNASVEKRIAVLPNRQRVTSRYVQMLFEHEGTTFTEFVRDARLNQAHRMLVDKRLTHRSVSAIAFDVGFGDLSYFNKVFRRRFGSSPSDVRATNARDA